MSWALVACVDPEPVADGGAGDGASARKDAGTDGDAGRDQDGGGGPDDDDGGSPEARDAGGDAGEGGNHAPVPLATVVGSAPFLVGEPVRLDGSGSVDVDGDALTFRWTQVAGASVSLDAPYGSVTELVAAEAGEVSFTLTVFDGQVSTTSAPISVPITAWSGDSAAFAERHPFRTRISVEGRAMALDGETLFVAAEEAGVLAFDVSNPEEPLLVGEYVEEGWQAWTLHVSDGLAAVGDESTWSMWPTGRLLDVSSPAAMAKAAEIGVAGPALIDQDVLYVAWDDWLDVYDVTDPTAPAQQSVGETPTFFGNALLAVAGDALYVAHGSSYPRLSIIDRSIDPIAEVDALEFAEPFTPFRSLQVAGQHAVMAEGRGVLVWFDVSDPFAPVEVASWDDELRATFVHVEGTRAYLSRGLDGIALADVADPAAPQPEARYQTWKRASEVLPLGSHAVVREEDAVTLIQVDPAYSPVLARQVALPGEATAVAAFGRYALVGTRGEDRGLHVIDLEAATGPVVVGHLPLDDVRSLSLSGHLAYVVDDAGLHVVDLRLPSAPIELGVHTSSSIFAAAVADGIAWIVTGFGAYRLRAIDLRSPATPVQLSSSMVSSPTGALAVVGERVFFTHPFRFEAFDVSDPAAPVRLTAQAGGGLDLDPLGELLVTTSANGVAVADVTDPEAVVGLGRVDVPGEQVEVASGRALVVEPYGYAGSGPPVSGAGPFQDVFVIDLRAPTAPALAGTVSVPAEVMGVALDGSRALLAASELGLVVVELDPKSADHDSAAAGSILEYSLVADDFPVGALAGVRCKVTGGGCTVAAGASDGTWQVSWTLPSAAGDHEIAITLGDVHHYTTTFDRVRVE